MRKELTMARTQSAALDRKKLMADPIMVTTIVVLITFLTLFILYPLAILLVDSFVGDGTFGFSIFERIFKMPTFTRAITNTLKVGFLVGILSALIGLLFAYVEVYVRMNKFVGGLFKVVSMLPVVSPPFVLSLSMIMLFGKAGLITRFLLKIYDNSVYGFWGIVIVQTLTFFPVCYMMLKGLLKNIDPSLEEAARDMGASRWKVFTSVTLPLMLPGLGNAFLVTFIESIADFANPMIIGGSYDTLATTIYLQITGAYDKQGAAAMAVVLLCITLLMFVVQKYVLEAKSTATLSGKASRARMLITDASVRIPLTVICCALAIFVVGGSEAWQRKAAERFPYMRFVGNEKNFDDAPLHAADVLVINTNAVSHAATEKAKRAAKGAVLVLTSTNNLDIVHKKIVQEVLS